MSNDIEGYELEASLITIGVLEVLFDGQRHMIVRPYSLERLHAAAKVMNIKRCWFHKTHYDIPKRRVAWFDRATKDTMFFRRVSPRQINEAIKLRQQVFESLDNAIANGYDDLVDWPADRIADDIKDYDANFERVDPEMITPYVKEWQTKRR